MFYRYLQPLTVPAAVGGKWRLEARLPQGERNYDVDIKQQYQELSGGARVQGGFLPLFEPRLEGERIRFVLVDDQHAHFFEGRVSGVLMEGTVKSGIGNAQVENRWRATRVVPGTEDGNQ